MIIFIGSDHGGFKLKANLKAYLKRLGHDVVDQGNLIFNPEDDFVDFAYKVAQSVADNKDARGILICRNGVGVCVAANKVSGVRAVCATHEELLLSSRKDDDTNIFCIGADYMPPETVYKLVSVWLEAPYDPADRHNRRLAKIAAIEQGKFSV